MIGEGVLHGSLNHPDVERVLVITRKTAGYSHPKLTEILHDDFLDFSSIKDRLSGYNACYYCIGVTSLGKNEDEYTKFTKTPDGNGRFRQPIREPMTHHRIHPQLRRIELRLYQPGHRFQDG